MKLLYLLLASCFLSALIDLQINPVHAGSPVQRISSRQAQGLTGTLPLITVWKEGGGTNLDFIPTEEKISQAWLDDLSQVTLDCNGSLCNEGNHSSTTVVHLRRIDKSIKFFGLPQTTTTLLSVITETPGGKQKLYQFQIAYGTGNAQYHTVRVEPDAPVLTANETESLGTAAIENNSTFNALLPPARNTNKPSPSVNRVLDASPQIQKPRSVTAIQKIPSTPVIRSSTFTPLAQQQVTRTTSSSRKTLSTTRPQRLSIVANKPSNQLSAALIQVIDDANAAAFGLTVAKHKNQINPATLTWKKAQGAIRQLRLGKSREEAARLAGLDMSILRQLIEWGQARP